MNANLSVLHAIVDVDVAARAGWTPIDLARGFLDGGARVLQLRAKDLPSGVFLDLSDAFVALAGEYGAEIIVNDRIDVARLSGAAGVHVGQEDLPPAAARAQLGPSAIIGFSTHTVAQVEGALQEPISYIAVGPVFGTATKDTGYTARGLDLVRYAANRGKPVVGIGGITLERARSVVEAGAAGLAVISDLLEGTDPERRVREFIALLAGNSLAG